MSDFAFLADISPSLVIRYLKSRDWSGHTLPSGMQLLTKDSGEFEIFLHSELGGQSLTDQVYFAVRTLSDYYEKEIEQIVLEIRSHLSDRISGRIPDEYVRNDSIEFRMASDYVAGMQAVLATSATTELTESRHFPRVLKEAKVYTNNCRFGHTFRGSFGFVIESPVGLNDAPTFKELEEELPLGRRVVERIANGLKHLERASQSSDLTLISSESSGLSSNMCEALADLIENADVSQLSLGIDLSAEWKSPSSGDAQIFKLEQSEVAFIREAAVSLKVEERPSEVEIIGRIRRVATDGVPSDLSDDKTRREIEINWLSDDETIVHVKLNVSPEEYLDAVDAHKNGKHLTVRGLLPPSGKSRRFIEHGPITILNV